MAMSPEKKAIITPRIVPFMQHLVAVKTYTNELMKIILELGNNETPDAQALYERLYAASRQLSYLAADDDLLTRTLARIKGGKDAYTLGELARLAESMRREARAKERAELLKQGR